MSCRASPPPRTRCCGSRPRALPCLGALHGLAGEESPDSGDDTRRQRLHADAVGRRRGAAGTMRREGAMRRSRPARSRWAATLAAVVVAGLTLAACGGSSTPISPKPPFGIQRPRRRNAPLVGLYGWRGISNDAGRGHGYATHSATLRVGTRTTTFVIVLLLCASVTLTACGDSGTTSTSPSAVSGQAAASASDASSPAGLPCPCPPSPGRSRSPRSHRPGAVSPRVTSTSFAPTARVSQGSPPVLPMSASRPGRRTAGE